MASPEDIIRKEDLPQCWSDDVRMNALFAPFRLKSANPESWQMKMKFWSDMLKQWCRGKNDPLVSAAEAKFALQRNGRTAACMDIVVEELLRNGELVPLSKYQQALNNGPEGWIHWGARLALKPAAVAVTTIMFLLPGKQAVDSDGLPKASIDLNQKFVLEVIVKELATEFLRNYPSHTERIGTIEDLMDYSGHPACKREGFEIILGYLICEGLAVKKDNIIKLAEPSSKVAPITESDEALYKLLAAEKKLQVDSDKYHREAAKALDDARVAVKLGNKVGAKSLLRRKHKCSDLATGCDSSLENVRALLSNMKQAEMNATVVNTYKMSADAMKKGMKDTGITEDAVHNTMDELKEVLDEYNEVGKALAGNVDDIDMQELENELSELMTSPGPSGGQAEVKPVTPKRYTRQPEPDFVFDGEERMIAELNKLSVEDRSPNIKVQQYMKRDRIKIPEGDWKRTGSEQVSDVHGADWAPPNELLSNQVHDHWGDRDDNFNKSYDELYNSLTEIHLNDKIHPGQSSSPSSTGLFGHEFVVQDHVKDQNNWLFAPECDNVSSELNGTEYFSVGSPGKSDNIAFQMAPGGERKKSSVNPVTDSLEDLEKRLKHLRGFNS